MVRMITLAIAFGILSGGAAAQVPNIPQHAEIQAVLDIPTTDIEFLRFNEGGKHEILEVIFINEAPTSTNPNLLCFEHPVLEAVVIKDTLELKWGFLTNVDATSVTSTQKINIFITSRKGKIISDFANISPVLFDGDICIEKSYQPLGIEKIEISTRQIPTKFIKSAFINNGLPFSSYIDDTVLVNFKSDTPGANILIPSLKHSSKTDKSMYIPKYYLKDVRIASNGLLMKLSSCTKNEIDSDTIEYFCKFSTPRVAASAGSG